MRLLSKLRREEAVRAGIELFGRRPYRDVDEPDICAACHLSPEDFYASFRTKRDFFLAVVEEVIETLMELTEPANPAQPLDDLEAKLEAFFDFARSHPQGTMAATHHAEAGPEIESALAPFRVRSRVGLANALGLENVDPNVDLVLWSWAGLNESIAKRLITDARVETQWAARVSTLGLIQMVEEALRLRSRELPETWSRARQRIRQNSVN